MHVTAGKAALCGLLLAFSVICVALGSLIEINTLFLLAAASYFTGIVIREFGLRTGTAFFLAGVFLSFLVSPNKFYVVSYGAMSLYILATEAFYRWMALWPLGLRRPWMFPAARYLLFNLMYLPVTTAFWHLLFAAPPSPLLRALVLVGGQVGLWLYDRAYLYALRNLWGRFRKYFFRA